jgi:hypothetical protein
MELIGFSTGSLARSDFGAALELLAAHPTGAVELSALRAHELRPLLDAIPRLDLSAFRYTSVHAPSAFASAEEREIASLLAPVAEAGWNVVIHRDTIRDAGVWAGFGPRLCVENMDPRKPCGRTVRELRDVFARLPEASFCLDLAHARQVDFTMAEAGRLLHAYGERLAQVHISDLDPASRHVRLSGDGALAYERISALIPLGVPVIIESPVQAWEIDSELELCLRAVGRAVAYA